jgi:hypothetical protein
MSLTTELQVANHADVDMEEEAVVTDPVSGASTTMRLPKYFQIKCALRAGMPGRMHAVLVHRPDCSQVVHSTWQHSPPFTCKLRPVC